MQNILQNYFKRLMGYQQQIVEGLLCSGVPCTLACRWPRHRRLADGTDHCAGSATYQIIMF